ncbi:MAG: hypothetical protein U0W24_16175 [Bacteroidales bacterium]
MKNLPALFLILTFVIFNFKLHAQINDFKLSDFKLPDLKRQGIDFTLYSDGQTYKSFDSDGDVSNDTKRFQDNLNFNYFLYRNSRKYQGYHSVGLSSSYYYSENSYYKIKSYGINLPILSENRFYFKKGSFLDLTLNSSIATNNSNEQRPFLDTLYQDIDRKDTENRLSTTIGFGKGRIERVEDARHAIYILQELSKQKRLSHEPSHEEILEFSKTISEIKNERVLDSRLKKIYELNMVDSVLHGLNLIDNEDMVYFSSLNDMWDFGGNIIRTSGFRYEFFYQPEYYFNPYQESITIDSLIKMETEQEYFKNKFGIFLDWDKPINQKLQSNLYSRIFYFIDNNISTFSDSFPVPIPEGNYKGIGGELKYNFGYYPNTRTSIDFGLSIDARKEINKDNSEEDYYSYRTYPYLVAKYYFSPKLSLNLYYNFTWRNLNTIPAYNKIKEHNYGFSLQYSIF